MITKRIIPCLDVKNGRVVKGVNFLGLADVSSPVSLAKYYSDCGADELVFYDITASAEGRALFTDILCEAARTVFIPLTVGGGIKFIPLTGVTLPFISYGGSSVMSTMMMFFIIQGIYIRLQQQEGERRVDRSKKVEITDDEEVEDLE